MLVLVLLPVVPVTRVCVVVAVVVLLLLVLRLVVAENGGDGINVVVLLTVLVVPMPNPVDVPLPFPSSVLEFVVPLELLVPLMVRELVEPVEVEAVNIVDRVELIASIPSDQDVIPVDLEKRDVEDVPNPTIVVEFVVAPSWLSRVVPVTHPFEDVLATDERDLENVALDVWKTVAPPAELVEYDADSCVTLLEALEELVAPRRVVVVAAQEIIFHEIDQTSHSSKANSPGPAGDALSARNNRDPTAVKSFREVLYPTPSTMTPTGYSNVDGSAPLVGVWLAAGVPSTTIETAVITFPSVVQASFTNRVPETLIVIVVNMFDGMKLFIDPGRMERSVPEIVRSQG